MKNRKVALKLTLLLWALPVMLKAQIPAPNIDFMGLLLVDYPKQFHAAAKINSRPSFDISFNYVNTAYSNDNNIKLTNITAEPTSLVNSNSKDRGVFYSQYIIAEYSKLAFSYFHPLSSDVEVSGRLEYYRFDLPVSFNSAVQDVHSFWTIKDHLRDNVLEHSQNNLVLIDQDQNIPVFQLDINKANSKLASLNLALKYKILETENLTGSVVGGVNLVADYLSQTNTCSTNCVSDSQKNYLGSLIFDYNPVDWCWYNFSLTKIYKERQYLKYLREDVLQAHVNFISTIPWREELLKNWAVRVQGYFSNDVNSTENFIASQWAFGVIYHREKSSFNISFIEDNGNDTSASYLDFSVNLSFKAIL